MSGYRNMSRNVQRCGVMHLVGPQREGERVEAGVGHDPIYSRCRNRPATPLEIIVATS